MWKSNQIVRIFPGNLVCFGFAGLSPDLNTKVSIDDFIDDFESRISNILYRRRTKAEIEKECVFWMAENQKKEENDNERLEELIPSVVLNIQELKTLCV